MVAKAQPQRVLDIVRRKGIVRGVGGGAYG